MNSMMSMDWADVGTVSSPRVTPDGYVGAPS
jgi:hypothetical protein